MTSLAYFLLIAVAVVVRVAGPLAAQSAPPAAALPRALTATGPLRLDGRVDDAAWSRADSISDFTQTDPEQGAPGSERTVVRFLRTAAGLWVGIIAYDREPALIRRAQLRRDASFDTDDHVRLILSPQRDQRTAVLFTVNANGLQHDADLVNFESENAGWDGVWDVRAQVTERGWEAELFIPWQTLRYPAGDGMWDLNIERFIRRKNETQRWRSWKRGQGIRLLENAGQVAGFTDLPRRALVELRPYGASTWSAAERDYTVVPTALVAPTSLHGDIGMDAKFAPTSTLTLDLTLNADFAQADVDNQVINLTRFPLFFPEQRGFFTENAGIFDFGRRGQAQLFYSRRIGLGADGLPVPLLAGARLTGRVFDHQVGLIAARTGGASPATSAVARVKHDVLGRGWIGALGTFQQADGLPSSMAGGVDFNFPFVVGGQNLIFLGLASASVDSSGAPARGFGRFVIDFPNDVADIVLRFDHVEGGFNPSLGFVQQSGINRIAGQLNLTPRPNRWGVRKFDFVVPEFDVVLNPDGTVNNARVSVQPIGFAMETGDEAGIGVDMEWDAPTGAFDLFTGSVVAPGRYQWSRPYIEVKGSSARRVSGSLHLSGGDFYDGRSSAIEASVSTRLEPHLLLTATLDRTAVERAAGSFTALTGRLRLDWATSARLNTTLFAQYDNESRRFASNVRLRWIPSPGSDLFVVWNNVWPVFANRMVPWERPERGALTVKYVQYLRY